MKNIIIFKNYQIMPKSFDSILSSKIKETFENYNEEFKPEDWQKMKAKLQPNKGLTVKFYSNLAKAAVVLAIVGIASLLVFKSVDSKQINIKNIANHNSYKKIEIRNVIIENQNFENQNNSTFVNNLNTNYNNNIAKNSNKNINQNVENNSYIQNNQNIANNVINNSDFQNNQNIANNDVNNSNNQNITNITNNLIQKDSLNNINENSKNQILLVETTKNNNEIIDTTTKNQFIATDKIKNDSSKIINKNIVLNEDIFKDDIFKTDDEKKTKKDKIKLGLAFSSNYNYSNSYNSNDLNFGGGIISDFEILNNFSLNTGILFANQSFVQNSKVGVFNKAEVDLDANIQSPTNQMPENMVTQSQLNLMGIDIPLNLQYEIKNFFVSAGVSSITYLNENKQYISYNLQESFLTDSIGNQSLETFYVAETVTENTKAFKRFDFAKIFNISFGYKIPINKNELAIEPYLKMPTGKLSSDNIVYYSGGVSIKYKF